MATVTIDRSRGIDVFLRRWTGLVGLCTQGGWIDNDTLQWRLDSEDGERVRVFVQFDEVLMEGSGCRAGEALCHGYVRLWLDADGEVREAQVE